MSDEEQDLDQVNEDQEQIDGTDNIKNSIENVDIAENQEEQDAGTEDEETTEETEPSEDPLEKMEEGDEIDKSQTLDESDVVTLTLNDVLADEDKMIEDAAAVLGAANEKECSYNDGYLKRQALYSCLTCIPEAKDDPDKAGGVCLACSFNCHDGHDLIELYTKRNFRCDCGNSKFEGSKNKCVLLDDKTEVNEMNAYNQNFSGTYCVCHRPYPDPEDPIPDEMIQCIICEDWYHSRHLGIQVPGDNFAEMTCEQCITKHEFLLHYDALTVNRMIATKETEDVDIESESKEDAPPAPKNQECTKPKAKSERVTAKFWIEPAWRKQLCTCDECLQMYENEDVAFLLDHEDPVHLYEEKSKAKAQAFVDDQSKKMMDSIPRVQLIDAIANYNELKENLGEYLKKFAENKKVVRAEDIKEFFEGMKARKRPRVEVPYHCR